MVKIFFKLFNIFFVYLIFRYYLYYVNNDKQTFNLLIMAQFTEALIYVQLSLFVGFIINIARLILSLITKTK